MERMNIVVLAGGTSTERAISIISGTGICGALREKGHKAILVDVFAGAENVNPEDPFPEEYDVQAAADYMKSFDDRVEEIRKNRRSFFGPMVLELCQKADICFLALHGANGEDGKLQAAFDLMGIRYSGTGYLSSAMAMDKGISKQMFRLNHVPVPEGFVLKKGDDPDLELHGMKYPVVVKTCCGGSSVGVYMVHDRNEYEEALRMAYSYEDDIVVEEYISGREFSVAVVDGRAFPVIEIQPLQGFYDYHNKYAPGSTIETCPAELSRELTVKMQKYAEAASQALGMEAYCRLDFMMRENGDMFCLEANTLPGMTPTSLIPQEARALGIDYPTLCEMLIEISLRRYL